MTNFPAPESNQFSQQTAQPAPHYPQYVPKPATGAAAWGVGLIAATCIPFISAVAASIVMLAMGMSVRKRGGIAAVNGKNAANWALTYMLATILLCGGHFVLLFAVAGDAPVQGFFPLGIPITLWFLISIAHVVFSIIGLVKANAGKTFGAPAIPFIR